MKKMIILYVDYWWHNYRTEYIDNDNVLRIEWQIKKKK